MINPAKIDPEAWYDENGLFALGFSTGALARARKAGALQCVAAGRNGRTIYLGRWVLDWLTSPRPRPAAAAAGAARA